MHILAIEKKEENEKWHLHRFGKLEDLRVS
jgi:hypothetical protein